MLDFITRVNGAVNNFVWGVPAMVLIMGVGLYLTLRLRFVQIRRFGHALRNTIGKIFHRGDAAEGSVTPFQAVCTALAATVGTGNIAGVAGAIAIGGPGAVFWMWVSALLVALVLLGGIRRIGRVAERLVPFMALLYVVLGLGVVALNLNRVPAAFAAIFRGAFNPAAVTGGVVGAMFTSMKKGVSRGIFSNEAGLGTASIAAPMAAVSAAAPPPPGAGASEASTSVNSRQLRNVSSIRAPPSKQTGDLAGGRVDIHPAIGGVGAGTGHHGDAAGHRTQKPRAAVLQHVPHRQSPTCGYAL